MGGQVSDAAIAALDAANSELKAKIIGLIPDNGPDYRHDRATPHT